VTANVRWWLHERRAEANHAILHVMRDGQQWFGYNLSLSTHLRAGRMYPALTRLLDSRLIVDGWQDPLLHRHPRRWYRISELGRNAYLSGDVMPRPAREEQP
jgi:hypothetical protein